ncbi:MAG: GHMP kinase, partial [Halohasta sp.]
MTTVDVGSRLHFGFGNLSLSHERLYGALGVALDHPRLSLRAERADEVDAPPRTAPLVETVCDLLDVPGAAVTVTESLPPHVGLGSGTQLALAAAVAIGGAYDRAVNVLVLDVDETLRS